MKEIIETQLCTPDSYFRPFPAYLKVCGVLLVASNKQNEKFHEVTLHRVLVGRSPIEAITNFPSALCVVGS